MLHMAALWAQRSGVALRTVLAVSRFDVTVSRATREFARIDKE